jgi:hypothetical protein
VWPAPHEDPASAPDKFRSRTATASPVPFAVRWNGHRWSSSGRGLPPFAWLERVSCVAARSCFVVGETYSNGRGSQATTAPLVTR